MKGEYFKNEFPLEHLLPEVTEEESKEIVMNCSYTIECNLIADADDMPECKVNDVDASVFYRMGWEAAQQRLNKILKPYEKEN